MSASFLASAALRREDSSSSTLTGLARSLSEQARITSAPPAIRRAPSSTSTTQHAASLDGTFSFGVCDYIDNPYDLGRLAMTSSTLLQEVRQLERVWMKACLEAYMGSEVLTLNFSDDFVAHKSWYRTFGVVMRCRDVLVHQHAISGIWGPSMSQREDIVVEIVKARNAAEKKEEADEMFAAIDTDGDGVLTREEYTEYHTEEQEYTEEEANEEFDGLDKDEDGTLSKEEFRAAFDDPREEYIENGHPGVRCDRSGMFPIIGTRYTLRGEDYDLCQEEYDKLSSGERAKYEAIQPPPPKADKDKGRCGALHWGDDEVWTRVKASPAERSVREAFAHLLMESNNWLDGAADPQSDNFPVFTALYTRKPGTSGDFVQRSIKTLSGLVFTSGMQPSGWMSYHFDEGIENAYMSFEDPSLWNKRPFYHQGNKLDDGSAPPPRKPFINPRYEEATRTFTGSIEWPEGWQGASRWEYEMVFSEDFESIIGGKRRNFLSDGTPAPRVPNLVYLGETSEMPLMHDKYTRREVSWDAEGAHEAFEKRMKDFLGELRPDENMSGRLLASAERLTRHQLQPSAVSVETILSAVRGTLKKICAEYDEDSYDESEWVQKLDLKRANNVRIARLESFAKLCVSGDVSKQAALSPGQAMRIVSDALEASESNLGDWDDDPEAFVTEESRIETCLAECIAASTELDEAAKARFKAALEDEIRQVEAVSLRTDGPFHETHGEWICSADTMNERAEKHIETIVDGLRQQILALAPNTPLDAPSTVFPLALSDGDFQPESLFGRLPNDHEGHIHWAAIAKEWVVLCGVKVSSC